MDKVKQVGGTHYDQGPNPQHWDLAIMYQWDPFQYQITKYVMRWKDKHPDPLKKLEDLQKALSFLEKYISNYTRYLPAVELLVQGEQVHQREVTPETINERQSGQPMVYGCVVGQLKSESGAAQSAQRLSGEANVGRIEEGRYPPVPAPGALAGAYGTREAPADLAGPSRLFYKGNVYLINSPQDMLRLQQDIYKG